MSIFRRVSLLGFALASLVALAACGGNGDGDGGGEAFQLPAPGEYSFEVTGTMEIEFLEEAVSAAPLALGAPMTSEFSGGITIKLGEDGKFTITDKEGVNLVTGDLEGGPIRFTQNEDNPSTGAISEDGMTIELNVIAELRGGVTATHEQPFLLEGDGNPFSDEGATLSTPPDAEAINFVSADEVDQTLIFGLTAVFIGLFGGFGFEEGADEEPATDEEPLEASCQQRGDVNGDGEVNSVDASLILQLNAGLIASLPCQEAADVNGDGAVTTVDAALILQLNAGLIESFPPDIPTDTEEQGAEFTDPTDDATDCATGETVDDPAVDIQSVSVRQVDTRVEVEVSMGQSPKMSLEDYYSFVILLYLFGWDYLVEFHAGERRQGQTDSSGNVIPGTEDDVTVTDDAVTFVIRDVDSIPDGSELEVKAFHMENQGSSVNCDTFMETLSLD